MIDVKDLKACRHRLHQNVEALRDHTVKLYQDNMSVVGSLRKKEVMQVTRTHSRNQGSRTLLSDLKKDSPGGGLHS